MGLDGDKQRIETVTSNPGHALWAGLLRGSEARLGEAEHELRLTLDSIPTITWRGASVAESNMAANVSPIKRASFLARMTTATLGCMLRMHPPWHVGAPAA